MSYTRSDLELKKERGKKKGRNGFREKIRKKLMLENQEICPRLNFNTRVRIP